MSEDSRFKKRMYVSAVAFGLAVGSVGIAAAGTGSDTDPTPTEEPAHEVQEPANTGSLAAPTEEESSIEADEAASLAEVDGVISPADAEAAASAKVPGDVISTELDNENGSIVYSVEIGDIDVKVDAGSGAVLDQQAGDDDDSDDDLDDIDDNDDDDVEDEIGDYDGDDD